MLKIVNYIFVLHITSAFFYISYGKVMKFFGLYELVFIGILALYIAYFFSKGINFLFESLDRVVINSSLVAWLVFLFIIFLHVEPIINYVGFATLLMNGEDNAAWVNQASGLYLNNGILLDASDSEFFEYGIGGVYLGYVVFLIAGQVLFEVGEFNSPLFIVGYSYLFYLVYSSLALIYLFNIYHKSGSEYFGKYIGGIFISVASIAIVLITLLPLAAHVGFLSLIASTCFLLWITFFILQFNHSNQKKINIFNYLFFIVVGYMAGQSWPFIFPVLMIFFAGCIFLKPKILIFPISLISLAFLLGGWSQFLMAISDRGGLIGLANTNGGSWRVGFFENINLIFFIVAIIIFFFQKHFSKRHLIFSIAFLGFYFFYIFLKIISPSADYAQSKIMLSGFVFGYALIFIISFKSRIVNFSAILSLFLVFILKIPPYSMPFDFYSKIKNQDDGELAVAISKINFNQTMGKRLICKPNFNKSSVENYYCARWVAAFSPVKGVEDRGYRNIMIRSNSANWVDQKSKSPWIDDYISASVDFRVVN